MATLAPAALPELAAHRVAVEASHYVVAASAVAANLSAVEESPFSQEPAVVTPPCAAATPSVVAASAVAQEPRPYTRSFELASTCQTYLCSGSAVCGVISSGRDVCPLRALRGDHDHRHEPLPPAACPCALFLMSGDPELAGARHRLGAPCPYGGPG